MYKVAVVAKAYATGFPPSPENSTLIDIEAGIVMVEATRQDQAEILAANDFLGKLYEERGGGPLWEVHAVASMEKETDDGAN